MFRTYQNALWQTQKLPTADRSHKEPGKRGHPPTKLTDEQALECRARHEFFGWTPLKCQRHYGTSATYMRSLLGYVTRNKLLAKPEHANIETN